MSYPVTSGPIRGVSELLAVDCAFLQGQAASGKAGVQYPLPLTANPFGRLFQIAAHPSDVYAIKRNGTRANYTRATLTLVDRNGDEFCSRLPLSRLDTGTLIRTKKRFRPLLWAGQVVDPLQSFITIESDPAQGDFRGIYVLEFIYK